jgi:hypothetical protein
VIKRAKQGLDPVAEVVLDATNVCWSNPPVGPDWAVRDAARIELSQAACVIFVEVGNHQRVHVPDAHGTERLSGVPTGNGVMCAVDQHNTPVGSDEQDALAVPDIKDLEHHEAPAPLA